MGIGLGIVLTVIGLALVMEVVNADLPWFDDYRLGVVLIVMGVTELLLVVITTAVRRGSTAPVIEHDA
jgi:hypothetical protein